MSACSSRGSCANTCASTPWAPTTVPAFLASRCRTMAVPAAQVRARTVGAGAGAGLILPAERGVPQVGAVGDFASRHPTLWNLPAPRVPSDGFVRPGRRAPSCGPICRAAPAAHPGFKCRARTWAMEAPAYPAASQYRARGGQAPAPGLGGLSPCQLPGVDSLESTDWSSPTLPAPISCETDLA